MTNFEQIYIMNKPRAITLVSTSNAGGESGKRQVFNLLEQSEADIRMRL
jgi:hypothetical protein